jgi:uncharacterized protein (DUF433 family)
MKNPLIVSNPNIMQGKPTIAGTRLTVEHILEELGAGRTIDELLAAYPRLTAEQIQAALTYAAAVLRLDVTYPLDTSVAS